MSVLYQNSDNEFRSQIKKAGVVQAPSGFTACVYSIYSASGSLLLSKDLDTGITIDGDDFVVKLDDAEMTMAAGKDYIHQMVVYNSTGDKLPPVFQRTIEIKQVLGE